MNRLFLLSPAKSSGRRAQLLTRPEASFSLALRLQAGQASLGEVFAFCSGLYFRGKLAYATRFARPPAGFEGIHVITASRGLVCAHARVSLTDIEEFSAVDVSITERRFTEPLIASVRALPACEIVLLGSIATGKYVEALLPILGERLLFPAEFIGRGDLSRGGLLLRSAAAGRELDYIPVVGAVRRGQRPPRLGRI